MKGKKLESVVGIAETKPRIVQTKPRIAETKPRIRVYSPSPKCFMRMSKKFVIYQYVFYDVPYQLFSETEMLKPMAFTASRAAWMSCFPSTYAMPFVKSTSTFSTPSTPLIAFSTLALQ